MTYCIGNLTDPSVHEICFHTVNSGSIYVSSNESLLSQHIYEKNISHLVPTGYAVLQLAIEPGNMVSQPSVYFLLRVMFELKQNPTFSSKKQEWYSGEGAFLSQMLPWVLS